MTVNIGTIHGGTASGSVPAHCEAKIDLRASRVADMETLKKKIEEVLAKTFIEGTTSVPRHLQNRYEKIYKRPWGLWAPWPFLCFSRQSKLSCPFLPKESIREERKRGKVLGLCPERPLTRLPPQ